MSVSPPFHMTPPRQHQHQGRVVSFFVPTSRPTAFTPVKPFRRRVSFAPTLVRAKTIDVLSHTSEGRSRLYHSREEMNEFYLDVKDFCTSHPDRPSAAPSSAPKRKRKECLVRQNADADLRGLELYFYPVRCRNKSLARKTLIKHYADLNADRSLANEERLLSLASASKKLSHWSKLVAMETARLDSVRAREGEEPNPILPLQTVEDAPDMVRRTVSFDGDEDDSRPTKRRRLVLA